MGALDRHTDNAAPQNDRRPISEALRMTAQQAKLAGVTLESSVESRLPSVFADRRRLKQILINLLANAIKFTPSGGRVSVRAQLSDDGIALTVRDTGIGIAQTDIPRAMERFGQVDTSLARKYEGVGLGLPLARELIAMHGGTLKLESEVNVGTVVTVTLPKERIAREGAADAAA